MAAKYVIKKGSTGKFRFNLLSTNVCGHTLRLSKTRFIEGPLCRHASRLARSRSYATAGDYSAGILRPCVICDT